VGHISNSKETFVHNRKKGIRNISPNVYCSRFAVRQVGISQQKKGTLVFSRERNAGKQKPQKCKIKLKTTMMQ
jgi:hypothetical protein